MTSLKQSDFRSESRIICTGMPLFIENYESIFRLKPSPALNRTLTLANQKESCLQINGWIYYRYFLQLGCRYIINHRFFRKNSEIIKDNYPYQNRGAWLKYRYRKLLGWVVDRLTERCELFYQFF